MIIDANLIEGFKIGLAVGVIIGFVCAGLIAVILSKIGRRRP